MCSRRLAWRGAGCVAGTLRLAPGGCAWMAAAIVTLAVRVRSPGGALPISREGTSRHYAGQQPRLLHSARADRDPSTGLARFRARTAKCPAHATAPCKHSRAVRKPMTPFTRGDPCRRGLLPALARAVRLDPAAGPCWRPLVSAGDDDARFGGAVGVAPGPSPSTHRLPQPGLGKSSTPIYLAPWPAHSRPWRDRLASSLWRARARGHICAGLRPTRA